MISVSNEMGRSDGSKIEDEFFSTFNLIQRRRRNGAKKILQDKVPFLAEDGGWQRVGWEVLFMRCKQVCGGCRCPSGEVVVVVGGSGGVGGELCRLLPKCCSLRTEGEDYAICFGIYG